MTLTPFPALPAAEFQGEVVSVLDGDTIEVLHNHHPERIRLNGKIYIVSRKELFLSPHLLRGTEAETLGAFLLLLEIDPTTLFCVPH